MKKFIPTLIAIILIIIVGAGFVVSQYLDKYSYSDEMQDMDAYFHIEAADDVAIILHNERIDTKAIMKEGVIYLDFDSIQELLNDRFYVDNNEDWLIYTTPTDVIKSELGGDTYIVDGEEATVPYTISFYRNETLYVALDYIKKYTNFVYTFYDNPMRIQLDKVWEDETVAYIKKDTAVRFRGGVKSPVLRNIEKGEKVVILDEMDTWTKVKTSDSIMGYVENKFLEGQCEEIASVMSEYMEPEYTSIHRDYKINLGWHAIYTQAGNDTFNEYTDNTSGLNVISPTWFSLSDNEGNYTSFADAGYVQKAHAKGMEVWALLENLNPEVSTLEIMSFTSKRERLVERLVSDVLAVGADGINLDFEQIPASAGEHYVEFIRELSVACRRYNLVLSVDNYVPAGGVTAFYNRKEQGIVADYVIIMGYDEHWGNGGVAGSVASLPYVKDGIEQTLAEVPSEKVINAIPFYTRVWKTNGGDVTSEALGMDATQNFINENGIELTWDAVVCQNYGEKQMGGTLYQVWVEDNESLAAKLNVMDAHNLAGVAEWKLGFENKEIWSIINAYQYK